MREICMSGAMSGEWKRAKVSYSGTGRRKSRKHARPHLNYRATPRLYSKLPPAVNRRSRQHRDCENSAKNGKKRITPGISGADSGAAPVNCWGKFRVPFGDLKVIERKFATHQSTINAESEFSRRF